jgi:predicted DNA-binding transcriptional regulator AlpA
MAARTKNPEEIAAKKKAIKERRKQTVADALKIFDTLPDSAHVRQQAVEGLFCCSSATVWRHVKQGRIPAPVRFSPGITAWNVGALRDALRSKQEA